MIGNKRECLMWLKNAPVGGRYEVKECKDKRTTNENAYFHRLVGLLARGSDRRFSAVKNELIREYGNHKLIRKDDKPDYEILPDNDKWQDHEIKHYYPTSYTDEFCGKKMRAFVLLAGTHTYNTAEMAQLIQCARYECEGSGIPRKVYETPEEHELWEKLMNDTRKDKGNGDSAGSQKKGMAQGR